MVEGKVSRNILHTAQALGYLLSLDENHKMNRVKLIKVLWVADRMHMRRFGRTISEPDYYAMVHGPVCSLALDIAQMSRDGVALSDTDIRFLDEYFTADEKETSMQKNVGDDCLSDTDKTILTEAWEKCKDIEAFDLADNISHEYPEWNKFRDFFANNGGRKKIDLGDFFKNPDGEDRFFKEDGRTLEAAKKLYEEREAVDNELSAIFGGRA